MDLAAGLLVGLALVGSGVALIWKMRHIPTLFSAALVLIPTGLTAIVGAFLGVTIINTIGGSAIVVLLILGLWLYPRTGE